MCWTKLHSQCNASPYRHPMVKAVVFEQLANLWEAPILDHRRCACRRRACRQISSKLSRSESYCVRRCANGCEVNSLRVGPPPETRSPSHVPMLFSTLHPRVLGNRLQILPMHTDGRRRPTCEWHRGCDDSPPLQMFQPSGVVFAACGGHRGGDDPPPSAMPGPGSSWQSLAPPCPH